MADSGYGLSVSHGSFAGNIVGVEVGDITRQALETTHFASTDGWGEYIASKIQRMEPITFTVQYNPDTSPPITGAAATLTITWPLPSGQSTAATWAVSAFVTRVGHAVALEEVMERELEFQPTGVPTFTASS